MKKLFHVSLSLLMGFWLTGCATIFGKANPQSVNINSMPSQAKVVIVNRDGQFKVFEGMTPTTVRLDKKKGYFSGKRYEVTISKEGFQDSVVFISPKLGGWYLAGNLVFGGLLGWLVVDPATGAMWNLSPTEINESLAAKQAGTRLSPGEIHVVLLEQVPQSLLGQMVPIVR